MSVNRQGHVADRTLLGAGTYTNAREKLKSRESRSRQASCQISTEYDAVRARWCRNSDVGRAAKIAARMQSVQNPTHDCTKSWHPPVDELHLPENKSDKTAKKQLTYKMAVVKTNSFFGSL
jgi:hypothetical protein